MRNPPRTTTLPIWQPGRSPLTARSLNDLVRRVNDLAKIVYQFDGRYRPRSKGAASEMVLCRVEGYASVDGGSGNAFSVRRLDKDRLPVGEPFTVHALSFPNVGLEPLVSCLPHRLFGDYLTAMEMEIGVDGEVARRWYCTFGFDLRKDCA